jgi:hypothetical protein
MAVAMVATTAELREWRQARGSRRRWTACTVLFGVSSLSPVIVAFLAHPTGTAWFALLLLLIGLGAIAALSFRIAWRVAHAHVAISVDGVKVAGALRTRTIALAEADRFTAGNAHGNQPTIMLLRRQGRPVPLWIFNRNGFIWQYKRLIDELQPQAEELNRALAAAKRDLAQPGLRTTC